MEDHSPSKPPANLSVTNIVDSIDFVSVLQYWATPELGSANDRNAADGRTTTRLERQTDAIECPLAGAMPECLTPLCDSACHLFFFFYVLPSSISVKPACSHGQVSAVVN
jgi:hypothetical protein